MELIRSFEVLGKNDAAIAGGKGASLGELIQAGIPVPPGFVVLTHAFERFLEEANLNQELDTIFHTVNHQEIGTVEKASERIQSLIIAAKMPDDIAEEIQRMFVELGTTFVAVRSSATAEDGANAAWAGQLDTFLNTTEETLLENVQKCWASLFTPRAIFYRFEKGMHGSKISVAVVVQKMVQSEVSGIAFSVHPVTEDYNQLIIEGGFGLGEAIVSGQVTPDSFVVEKEPRRIIDKNITFQNRALWRAEIGGNEWRELSQIEGNKPALSDEQVMELAEIVLHIESHYGFPCDIEWAVEAGVFFITQSRPITTLSSRSETHPPTLKEKWHYWGQWKSPLLVDSPYSTYANSRIALEWHPLKGIKGDQVTYDGHFFTLVSDLDSVREEIMEALEGRGDFFQVLEQYCVKEEKALLALENGRDLELFFRQMENLIGCSMTAQYVGQVSRDHMKEKCTRAGIAESDVLAAMRMPAKTRREEYENELKDLKEEEVSNFVKKYEWITTYLYEGDPLTVEKVLEEKAMLKNEAHNTLPTTIPNGFDPFIHGASMCAYWRTRNAETMNKVAFSYRGLLQEFADKHGVPYEKVIQMTHREIIGVLQGGSIPSDVLQRDASWGMEYLAGEFAILSAEDSATKLKDMPLPKAKSETEVEGVIAFKGIARGTARIVITYQEIAKVKQGDIIIANETTPDYIPAMKRAAAFVTNQGGITSHAAIVAREMRKPCIVGTSVATQVFKDGDFIEVDGDHGIIRIVKKVGLPVLDRQDFIHTFASKGMSFVCLDTYFAPYMPVGKSMTLMRDGALRDYMAKQTMQRMQEEGLKRTAADTRLQIEKIDRLLADLAHGSTVLDRKEYLSKDQVTNIVRLMGGVFEAYSYFDVSYWELVYKSDTEDAKANVRLVQENKNVFREKLEPVLFADTCVLNRLTTRLSEQFNVPPADILWYRSEELTGLFDEVRPTAQNFEARKMATFFYKEGTQTTLFVGGDALAFMEQFERDDRNVTELRGVVANLARKSVRGSARIITRDYESEEATIRLINTMQDGEILIADATDPEFLTAMKKAVAIVTDVGGMLSHAAITSRELCVTCIVATQLGTKVFKNGDMVEVDAQNGIVRKI